MKADQTEFGNLVANPVQYRVPIFQRPYRWELKQWERLWSDIDELYESGKGSHFIGSVVTSPFAVGPENRVKEYLLIDGQQRLTTLIILLRVMEQEARRTGNATQADDLSRIFLINPTQDDSRKYKLCPTQKDREAFAQVMRDPSCSGESRIHKVAVYFAEELGKGDSNGKSYDLAALESTVAGRLEFVSVKLESGDSPHRIFESLNAKGMRLSAGDLIRNFILMKFPVASRQEQIYNDIWHPLEKKLGSRLTDFFWRFLMMDGESIRWDDIYEKTQERVEKAENLEGLLHRLLNLGGIYRKIAEPKEAEENNMIREAMMRLNQWELNTAYPYLLKMFEYRDSDQVNDEDCEKILGMLESYAIRRFFCDVPTNRLRNIFAQIARAFDANRAVDQCEEWLVKNDWPSDSLLKERFASFPLYQRARNRERLMLILGSIERKLSGKERVEITSDVTVEHIMPRTMSEQWQNMLGENWEDTYQRLLHTVGNLALTAYNSEMGNKEFGEKCRTYLDSRFEMTKRLSKLSVWNAEAIKNRSTSLAETAATVWKRPAE